MLDNEWFGCCFCYPMYNIRLSNLSQDPQYKIVFQTSFISTHLGFLLFINSYYTQNTLLSTLEYHSLQPINTCHFAVRLNFSFLL